MMLAETSGLSTFLLGLGILAVAWVLRRSISRSRQERRSDTVRDVQETLRRREDSAMAAACKAEIRLHEVARECEAAVSTRIALLEQLIRDADDRIVRLRGLLRSDPSDGRSVPLRMHPGPEIMFPADRQGDRSRPPMAEASGDRRAGDGDSADEQTDQQARRLFVVHMAQAGFNAAEIAHFADMPQDEVDAILRAVGLGEVTPPGRQSDRAEAA